MSEQIDISAAGKYLTFALAHEEYGVPALKVREIIKVMDITPVPHLPAHMKGVINLRGRVIPVVDLRLKFGLPSDAYTDRTCIVVGEVELAGQLTPLGMIVDSVSEVLNISADEIEAMPKLGQGGDTEYMQGVAKVKGTVTLLLNLDKVLSADSLFGRAA